MAWVSWGEGVVVGGGEEGVEDGEVVVLAEEVGEGGGVVGEGLERGGVEGGEEFEVVAEVLGAFAPIVEVVVGGVGEGAFHGAAAVAVGAARPGRGGRSSRWGGRGEWGRRCWARVRVERRRGMVPAARADLRARRWGFSRAD